VSSIEALARPRPVRIPRERATALSLGFVVAHLSVIVALPMAALIWESTKEGSASFWAVVTSPQSIAALKLSFGASFVIAVVNGVAGTLIAWVLVRDEFRGKRTVNAIIDLPFALPTIVAGLVLLALYGPSSPIGVDVAFSRTAIVLALLFVTLPFVVRTVQPVLHELDREMEQAARSLGASEPMIFRRIVLPNILPGILSGVALAFARAVGEIGALVIISGSLPFKTEVASVYILSRVESGDRAGAAAIAVVLLVSSFLVILGIGVIRRLTTRHDLAQARA
jgi:sulfate transport system permease protein